MVGTDRGLQVERRPDGIGVRLELPEATHELELRVRGATSSRLDGAPTPWPLWAGVPTHSTNSADPFHRLYEKLTRGCRLEALQATAAPLREAAMHAAERCDPAARTRALRFLPHARWFVYEAIATDPSGRTAELADACPGLLVLARGLLDHAPERLPELLAQIRAGTKLRELIDLALLGWTSYAERHRSTSPTRSAVWLRVREEGAPLLARQRLLVRRASAGVPTALLWLPPPIAFAPEDIPSAPRANARWYRAVKSLAVMTPPAPEGRATLEGLSHFLSKNADAIATQGRREGKPTKVLMRELVRLSRDSGHYPGRASAFETVLFERRALDRDGAALTILSAQLAASGHAMGTITASSPLQPWAFGAWVSDAGDHVEQLSTVGALFAEGARMRHCVATRAKEALLGTASLWSARIRGVRLTVQLTRYPWGVAVTDLKGVANAGPSDSERAAIHAWLDSMVGPVPRGWHPTMEALAEARLTPSESPRTTTHTYPDTFEADPRH